MEGKCKKNLLSWMSYSAANYNGQHVTGAAIVSVLAPQPAKRPAEAAAIPSPEYPPHSAATTHR